MKTITCPDCGKTEIHTTAYSCPACNHQLCKPKSKKEKMIKCGGCKKPISHANHTQKKTTYTKGIRDGTSYVNEHVEFIPVACPHCGHPDPYVPLFARIIISTFKAIKILILLLVIIGLSDYLLRTRIIVDGILPLIELIYPM